MKTLEEIYQALAGGFQSRTGLSAGSSGDLAVRFYAVAAQLYSLYVQADWTRRQCFPQTAEGESLDCHAQMRGLSRREASRASGTVRFYIDGQRQEETAVAAGTVCMTAGGVRFAVTADAAAAPGETELDAPVEAVEPGKEGNVPAGAVIYLAVAPEGVTACVNPEGFTGGQDREDDDGLRQRVLAAYRRLANGANSEFYRQAAMSFDGVAAVAVLPKRRGTGTVDLVVSAEGGVPDKALLERLQAYFDTVREIAVDVKILAPELKSVDVSAVLTPAPGYGFADVSRRAEQALRDWFTGKRLGKPVLRAELTSLLFGVEGVGNCVLTLPAADTAVVETALPVLGRLTMTEG